MLDPLVRATMLAPSAHVRPYVRQFLIVETLAGRANTLLPDSSVIAGIRFRGECSHDGQSALRAVVTGLRDKPRRLTHPAGSATMLAMLTPHGAAALMRDPLEDLFNTTRPLDTLVRSSLLDVVEEQLAGVREHGERVRVFETFLLENLKERQADPLVRMAVSCIRESRGRLRIEDLAHRAGLSQSTLERRFRREVGASPKKFASIVRLRHVVRLRQQGVSLTEIAHAAGYADQPHFIKDFKRMAGQSPEAFFRLESAGC